MSMHGKKINEIIEEELEAKGRVALDDVKGQHLLASGLRAPNVVSLKGYVGDYCFSLNSGAHIHLNGDGGRFLADTMTSGEVVINGNVSHGLGFSLYGGYVVVRGNAGGRLGQMNKGGTIIVDGNTRDSIGLYSLSGDIIITKNAGRKVGDWMIHGNIYIGGKHYELGHNVQEEELNDEDIEKLSHLFYYYDIDRPLEKFTKVVPISSRPFYKGDDNK